MPNAVANLVLRPQEIACGIVCGPIEPAGQAWMTRERTGLAAELASWLVTDAGGGGAARRIIRSLRRRELLLSNAFGNDDVTPMASGLRGYLWIFPLAGGAVTRALASGDFGLEGHEHELARGGAAEFREPGRAHRRRP